MISREEPAETIWSSVGDVIGSKQAFYALAKAWRPRKAKAITDQRAATDMIDGGGLGPTPKL